MTAVCFVIAALVLCAASVICNRRSDVSADRFLFMACCALLMAAWTLWR